jgi:hypothetical protein
VSTGSILFSVSAAKKAPPLLGGQVTRLSVDATLIPLPHSGSNVSGHMDAVVVGGENLLAQKTGRRVLREGVCMRGRSVCHCKTLSVVS